jgi:copper(I)-binding protein
MLNDLVRHYREGDSLTITVVFARGGQGTFRVPVVSYVDVADHIQFPH